MSLVADYGSSSDNDSDSSNCYSHCKEKITFSKIQLAKQEKLQLPTPILDKKISDNLGDSGYSSSWKSLSVFSNPFLEAEHTEEAMLQKHVQMVNTKDVIKINGKKICWNYRKGRCRFGHNCKFAHDSDIQRTREQLKIENERRRLHSVVCQSSSSSSSELQANINKMSESSLTVIENFKQPVLEKKCKKRQGLCDSLIPGRKIMRKYLNDSLENL